MGLSGVDAPAPVHLTPEIERLWTVRVRARHHGDLQLWRETVELLLSRIIAYAFSSYKLAVFETALSVDSDSGMTVRLAELIDLAGKAIDWCGGFSEGEAELIRTLQLDLIDIFGVPETGQLVIERPG